MQTTGSSPRTLAASNCQLKSPNGKIKHVIFIIFDNVHFLRDNPNVPSDVEQMPHLLNFIRGNGTMMTNDHTVLISHTANGILTNLTGMYSDRHGQAVSNSFRYFRADGSTASSSSFKYWTDLTDDVSAVPTDPTPVMVNGDSGSPKNTPAPWVPYTRAGCDFGATALANVVLENTGTGPNGDMTKVFGSGSPEWNEAVASNAAPAGSAGPKPRADRLRRHRGSLWGRRRHLRRQLERPPGSAPGRARRLQRLPGAFRSEVRQSGDQRRQRHDAEPERDVDYRPVQSAGVPRASTGSSPRPPSPTSPRCRKSGIPITYGYISDAHDQHGVAGEIHATRGPGEADYVQQLKNYDDAFAKFFARLEADGINKSNTLFAFTVEEGDHFAGSKPTNPGCDGVNVPCTYSLVGEVNGNLAGLMAQDGVTTPFTVHADMAPTIYITGNPARDAPVTRTFGRTLAKLNRVNPYTGQGEDLSAAVADPVGMKALHMITADPQRTPTLTMFAQPDWFFFTGAPNCNSPCVTVPTTPPTSTFAWNHGGIQPEIATTWLGLVGPGVRNNGDDATWADHTDVRPTMLDLVGLGDSYVHDGRVLIDQLDASAVPQSLRAHRETLRRLGDVYKQLNAPFGTFSMSAAEGVHPGDQERVGHERQHLREARGPDRGADVTARRPCVADPCCAGRSCVRRRLAERGSGERLDRPGREPHRPGG